MKKVLGVILAILISLSLMPMTASAYVPGNQPLVVRTVFIDGNNADGLRYLDQFKLSISNSGGGVTLVQLQEGDVTIQDITSGQISSGQYAISGEGTGSIGTIGWQHGDGYTETHTYEDGILTLTFKRINTVTVHRSDELNGQAINWEVDAYAQIGNEKKDLTFNDRGNAEFTYYPYDPDKVDVKIVASSKTSGYDVDEITVNKDYLPNITVVITPKVHEILSKYTVKYDANGGTGTMDDDVIILKPGEKRTYTVPACKFTRAGYKFKNWADMNGGQIDPGYKEVVEGMQEDYEAVAVLKAVWEKDPANTSADKNSSNKTANANGVSPKTGDSSNVALWVGLSLAALAVLATVLVIHHRKKKED